MPAAPHSSKLLHALYGAVAEPAGWQAMAPIMAQAFGGRDCLLAGRFSGMSALDAVLILSNMDENLSPELVQLYQECWQDKDPLVSGASRGVSRSVYDRRELVIETEFLRTEYYNEYYRHRKNVFHSMGCVVPLGQEGEFCLLALGRPRSEDAFAPEQKRDLSAFIPHLQQTLQLWTTFARLRAERDFTLDALDALHVGIMVADASSAVSFANPMAESLLRSRSELSIRYGRLRLHDPEQDQTLQRVIRDAVATAIGRGSSIGGIFAVRRTGARPLSLRVCPMPERLIRNEPFQRSALVFLSDPDWHAQSLCEMLGILYGLTPMEARLAEALANGEALVDYAARVRISMNTANTHLRQIFSKTGQRRQSQLIREILSNPLLRMTKPGNA